MAFRIITADERLSAAENKTSLAIFGPPGVGKTVISPFLAGCIGRIHAAIFSFWAGVRPPMPMFGRSLL